MIPLAVSEDKQWHPRSMTAVFISGAYTGRERTDTSASARAIAPPGFLVGLEMIPHEGLPWAQGWEQDVVEKGHKDAIQAEGRSVYVTQLL
jgi:hypothetical protein